MQPHTGKRKPEDSNPLLNAAAAKRAKKEAKLGAAKRKLNNEEGQSSLLIVRAQSEVQQGPTQSQPVLTHSKPNSSSQSFRFSSQPLQDTTAGPSRPPSKKFKADGRGASAAPLSRNSVAFGTVTTYEDADVESDVRAMEDEADHLRRQSRAHTTIDTSILADGSAAALRLPPRASSTVPPSSVVRKGKAKVVDIQAPMHNEDTPKMDRNKQLRAGAMAAIVNGRAKTPERNGPNATPNSARRKSSAGRGKRISSSFEATGIITQPHNSVSETSFYKHIDVDLPEPERIRQLLIWCSLRAAAAPTPGKSTTTTPSPSLPPLSDKAAQVLKSAQEEVVRMLAEKKVDLSFELTASMARPEDLQENEQNVRNRQWEVTYTSHIQQAQLEEEAWKKVSYGYDAYKKKQQASLEKRTAVLQDDDDGLAATPGMSSKAKGKRRATGDIQEPSTGFLPNEHDLPADFQSALNLAKGVLGLLPPSTEPEPDGRRRSGPGGGAATGRYGKTRTGNDRAALTAEIAQRLPGLEFHVDRMFGMVNVARTSVNLAERVLSERFDVLNENLTGRLRPYPDEAAVGASGAVGLMKTYVKPSGPEGGADALDLMRALSRVDQERPPGQVGDAVRRAAREVQRAGEAGFAGAVGGDKRITGLPPTPRKAPGTPRRGNTPARDR